MSDLIKRLGQIDCCAVSDALDSLGLPPAVAGLPPLTVRRRIAGRVVTVKLGKAPPEGGSKRHLGTGAIEAASAGDVILVQHTERDDCAGWGGVLSTGASLKGISGVVIDGACRDIDEAIALDFPIYGRAAIAVTARGRVYEQDFNCPIEIGGIEVQPGDYLLADSSGVALIPAARIEQVIVAAETIARKESLMVQELRKGTPITQVMGLNYEKMLGTQD
jgi:4-hydroxy-4-methyl-2-oxoglutarate aldolase